MILSHKNLYICLTDVTGPQEGVAVPSRSHRCDGGGPNHFGTFRISQGIFTAKGIVELNFLLGHRVVLSEGTWFVERNRAVTNMFGLKQIQ